jgi:hypothetical protein
MLFYLFPLGLSVVNLTSVVVAFRDSINTIRGGSQDQIGGVIDSRSDTAMREVRQVLALRSLWIISLFYFLYLGVAIAAGGKKLYATAG